MLEFVHLNGSATDKDAQTRRKVRSQAMRDFRRRQRAEREAAQKRDDPRERSTKKDNASQGWQPRPRTIATCPSSISSRASSSYASSLAGMPIDFSTPITSFEVQSNPACVDPLLQSTTIWQQQPGASLEHECSPPLTLPLRSKKGSAQAQGRKTRKPTSRPTKRRSQDSQRHETVDLKRSDPLQSAAVLNHMSDYCKTYTSWLQPDADIESIESALSTAWVKSQCPMLLASCFLASVGHLDAVQPNQTAEDHAAYKARILEEVSERVKSPVDAISDDVIGTLACLLSFELSRSSKEALTHLHGLRSIITMRGGMCSIGSSKLRKMLEALDLIHAVTFRAKPILTVSESQINDNKTGSAFEHFTRLLLAEQSEAHLSSDHPCEESSNIGQLLEQGIRIAEANTPYSSSSAIAQFDQCLASIGLFPQPQALAGSGFERLTEATRYAGMILQNLLVAKLPFSDAANVQHADSLYAAVQKVSDRALQRFPYLWLWVLLSGVAASHSVTAKKYFTAQIMRTIYQMGFREFRRVKGFLLRFLTLEEAMIHTPSVLPLITPSPSIKLDTSPDPPHPALLPVDTFEIDPTLIDFGPDDTTGSYSQFHTDFYMGSSSPEDSYMQTLQFNNFTHMQPLVYA